jgi:hypothetical protein
MAMYPNATHGYMPFVKPTHKRQAAKKTKCDKASLKNKASTHSATDMKTYKVTLRDRNGFTYTYIIQADTTSTKSMPVLCESRIAAPRHHGLSSSLPNMTTPSPSASPESRRHAMLAQGKEDLTKVDDGEKKGLFRSLISFIMKKTGSSKSSSKQQVAMKSKRKTKPMFPKKRQRTISTISNLDPIQESPEEDDDFDGDSDSYTHDSASVSGVDSASDNEGSES